MKIIGEIGQAHDGSLGAAHALVDAIADAGADAVKFQTHIAEAESSIDEPWRTKFSDQDESRYAYWQRMEFTPDQWYGLKKHVEARKLVFMSSPFSVEAVDLLEQLDIEIWKVPSGEVSNPLVLQRILKTRKPILLSSGLSNWTDIDRVVKQIRAAGVEFGILQCTTSYPTKPEEVGLNVLAEIKSRYGCATGLSDHSGKVYAGLAAATLGADWLECHIALSRQSFGPDVTSSITPAELTELVLGAKWIEKAVNHPLAKDSIERERYELVQVFTQSLVAKRDLEAGHILTMADLTSRKPGVGIPVKSIHTVIGRQMAESVATGEFLKEADFLVEG